MRPAPTKKKKSALNTAITWAIGILVVLAGISLMGSSAAPTVGRIAVFTALGVVVLAKVAWLVMRMLSLGNWMDRQERKANR